MDVTQFNMQISDKSTLVKQHVNVEGFFPFVWMKSNRVYLSIAVIGSVLAWVIFKKLYPFPDFISDSYSYIYAAAAGLKASLWPIGYSKFLWFIHKISYTDLFLLSTQYVLLQVSQLYLFFSLCYLFKPEKRIQRILYIALVFNPLTLYISNCVLSDALFGALTVVWFVDLLWILFRVKKIDIWLQALIIGIAFTIRYTAIYYPLITLLCLLISGHTLKWKIVGGILTWLPIIWFVLYTQNATKEITGTAQFSVFGGWQIANNALYMYSHVEVNPNELPPETTRLDSMVKAFHRLAPPGYINLDDFPGTYFIKHPDAPLKQYVHRYAAAIENIDSTGGIMTWGAVSPMYQQYGNWLIKHYPFSFARYYLWLNAKNYCYPYLEKLGYYNIGMDSVWLPAQYWFRYPTPRIKAYSKELQGTIFTAYPAIWLMLNCYFIYTMVIVLWRKWKSYDHRQLKFILLIATYLVINFCFSVYATPIVFRYQLFPFMLLMAISLLQLEWTDKRPVATKVNY